MKKTIPLLILFVSITATAEEVRLRFLDIFTKIPETSIYSLKQSFSNDSLEGWGMIIGSTAILYHYDEQLYSWSKKKGRDWGIGNEDNTKPILQAYGQELLRVPDDLGSALYFLGDGWLHIGTALSFMGYGHYSNKTYEVNTGIILLHGMVVSTIFNQTLKRSFGRESPEVKTSERGAWNLFPSFNDYNSRTASFDAMPSGHVMTATLTFTVLAERYSEYKIPIYSVGGIWISALMFQMMNNGVHWASDYPLGIAMGWVFGKAATQIVSKSNQSKSTENTGWNILPMPTNHGMNLVATKRF